MCVVWSSAALRKRPPLRGSGHKRGAPRVECGIRRASVVFGRHGIGSLCVRRGGEVEELVCEGEVAALLGRRVRLHQHPLAQDVLGVLRTHPRRRLRTVAANRRPPPPQECGPVGDLGGVGRRIKGGAQRREEVGVRGVLRERGHLCQLAPHQRVVHLGGAGAHQGFQVVVEERRRRCACVGRVGGQPKLPPPHVCHRRVHDTLRLDHDALRLGLSSLQQRRHARRQHRKVGHPRTGLVHKRKVLPGPNPLSEERVVRVHPPKGAVVHRASAHQAVVCVEVALAEADAEPSGDHVRDGGGGGAQERGRRLGRHSPRGAGLTALTPGAGMRL
mmetsp:Transcript_42619/g.68539  ORF Transcript_42619/g.68539 Transcript_42619/m.68539 type:complete len:331 (+) Transcript_42619:628-1620(+)